MSNTTGSSNARIPPSDPGLDAETKRAAAHMIRLVERSDRLRLAAAIDS